MTILSKNKTSIRGFALAIESIFALFILTVAIIALALFLYKKIDSIFHAEEITAGTKIGASILRTCAQNSDFDSIVNAENLAYQACNKNYTYDIEASDVVSGKIKLIAVKVKFNVEPRKGGIGKNYIVLKRFIRKQE